MCVLAGSYVALTVLGRPPGLAQIPLPEAEPDMSLSSPNSPAPQRPCSPQDSILPIQQPWVLKTLVTSVAFLLPVHFLQICHASLSYSP